METSEYTFENETGGELKGRLDSPSDATPFGYVLFAHCCGCSGDMAPLRHIARALTERSMAVFSFDFTGLQEGARDEKADFAARTSDFAAAAYFMEAELQAPRVVVGHSLGGTAALYAARDMDSVRAVAAIAPVYDAGALRGLLEGQAEKGESGEPARASIGGRPFCIHRQFLDALEADPPEQWLADLNKEVLVLHSPSDTVVDIENGEKIFRAVGHPKSFVGLDRADHLLSEPADAQHAARMIAAWAQKFASTPEAAPLESEQKLVARIGVERYVVDMKAGRHTMVADEPKSSGGTNAGPDPYDYLLAALGSCTAMTLRSYADRKKWPLKSAVVQLRHDRVHSSDCEECEKASSRVDKITRMVELSGDLSTEQRERLVEIADKCPVSRTLTTENVIETTEIGGSG